jgi:secondary thiamine-phosphate synthase enzyme
LRQVSHRLPVSTRGKGLYEITREVADWLARQGVSQGLLTLFVQHTSASLTIQENADPDVLRDLNAFFDRLAPEDNRLYRHTLEGADDMPAHIRSALTLTSLSIPVEDGRLALGAWQGIYVFEHRSAPHRRNVLLHLLGE